VKSIFDVLERLKIKEEAHVREMPYNKVVGIQKNSKVSDAVWLMREHGYSQLPVFDGERVIGSISEKTILSQILTGKDLTQLSMLPVWEIVDEAYPQVGEDTPRSLVSNLLQVYQAVLISRKGKILGIITKADLLRMLP
jgi:predicted transcriptional regulator